MIVKKTEMTDMPKNCCECIYGHSAYNCHLPFIFDTLIPDGKLEIIGYSSTCWSQRHEQCPLIDTKDMLYEAERVDNGEIIKGYYNGDDKRAWITYIKPTQYGRVKIEYEVKPETIKICEV